MLPRPTFRISRFSHSAISHSIFSRVISVLTRDIDIEILSVRLSVTRWHCIKTTYHIVIVFSPYGSPIILFYHHQTSSRNSDGVTPCGDAKYWWGIKCRDFLPISRYISQMIQDIAIVTTAN